MASPQASAPRSPVPAALISGTAAEALRRAFANEVRTRLPGILAAARGPARPERARTDAGMGSQPSPSPRTVARADAELLAGTCGLLGDDAAARALWRLAALLADPTLDPQSDGLRGELADQAALLLGRWLTDGPAQT